MRFATPGTRERRAILARAGKRLALLALLLAASPAQAETRGYRLAGIVAVGEERLLAVIELPDGRQGLFRADEPIGEGVIQAITPEGVRILLGDEAVYLSLRGRQAQLVTRSGSGATPTVSTEAPAAVRSTPLRFEETVRMLTSSERVARREAATPSDVDLRLRAAVNDALGIPPEARITAVDRDQVATPQAALDVLLPRLAAGRAVRLSLDGVAGLAAVYVTPVEAP